MAWTQDFAGVEVVGERAERALRLPFGVTSPLWAMFGAAASVGVAYWWMTRWTRAVNFEALAPFTPALIASEPEAIFAELPAAIAAPVEAIETAPEPEALVEAIAPVVETIADDLTVMTGIGPKLSAALAERGVTRFAQIATWTADDLAKLDGELSLKGRAVREAWVAQAKRLAAAK
jgi:predicted flap endonuclease-1-like 5' DNA nuclease